MSAGSSESRGCFAGGGAWRASESGSSGWHGAQAAHAGAARSSRSRRPDRRLQSDGGAPQRILESVGRVDVDSLDALLDDKRISAVLISTPPRTHAELALRAARAGKHVLVEKPLDIDHASARRLVDEVEALGRTFGVVFQHRFRLGAIALREHLREAALGDLVSVSASIRWWRSFEYFAEPGRGTMARDAGGVLLTQAIHTLDLLLDLVGPVKRVTALVRTSPIRSIDTEDIACATVEYANGAVGIVDATTTAYPGYPERIEIAGTKGSALLEGERLVLQRHGTARLHRRGRDLRWRRRGSDGVLARVAPAPMGGLPRRGAGRAAAPGERAQCAARSCADRYDARFVARAAAARGTGSRVATDGVASGLRTMKIRSQLVVLVLAAIAPVAILAAITTFQLWQLQRETYEQRFLERVTALRLALDTELEGTIRTLRSLADSADFDPGAGPLQAHAHFERLTSHGHAWITMGLVDAQGDTLVRVDGEGAPEGIEARRGDERGRSCPSELRRSPTSSPFDDGRALAHVHRGPGAPQRCAERHRLRRRRASRLARVSQSLSDRQARDAHAERPQRRDHHPYAQRRAVGRQAVLVGVTGTARSARPRACSRASGSKDSAFYSAFSRSEQAGWVLGTGVPRDEVEAGLSVPTTLLGLGIVTAIILASLLALFLGRRVADTVTALANYAKSMAGPNRPTRERTAADRRSGDGANRAGRGGGASSTRASAR